MNRFLQIAVVLTGLLIGVQANSTDRSTWPSPEIVPMRIATFPVDRTQVNPKALETYYGGRETIDKALKNSNWNMKGCPVTTSYIHRILTRLVVSSNLGNYMSDQKAPIFLEVACHEGLEASSVFSAPASLSFGRLKIAGAFMKLFGTEDEIAFVIAHELSHYLLAHDILSWDWSEKDIGQIFLRKKLRERDADMVGLQLLTNAGYNPNGAVRAYTIMFDRFDQWDEDPHHFNHRYLVYNLNEQIKVFGYRTVPDTNFPKTIASQIAKEVSSAPLCSAWRAKLFGC